MKKILFIFLVFLPLGQIGAQVDIYFSFKKTSGGVMVGTEAINLKLGTYQYEWTFPDISLNPQKTRSNKHFVSLDRIITPLFINLKITRLLKNEVYHFKTKIDLPNPKVKIVRKSQGILMPLEGKAEKNDSLTVLLQDFSSKNFQYLWDFNGIFVSNEKEISLKILEGSSGVVRVNVFGSLPQEKAVDVQTIKIE